MTDQLQLALIGENIEYSRSPGIFEAIFKQLDITGRFALHSVSTGQLGRQVRQLVAAGVRGFSVTIPHKQAVMESLDAVDEVARVIEAVNSVGVKDGRLVGYNTDCHGFSFALQRFGYRSSTDSALILGNGGAARAAIYALHQDYSIERFFVAGRSEAMIRTLKQALEQRLPALEIIPCMVGDTVPAADIVVNCTPLGGANHSDSTPFPDRFSWSGVRLYYDLNYNADNRAIGEVRSNGIDALNGSAMLVAQAIKSFELWTGRSVAFEPIYQAVFGDR